MIEVVDTGINSFAPVASQADVSPIEEPVFILTSRQLQDLVQEAIERATTPLEVRIESLERGVGSGKGGEERIRSLPGGQETQIATFQVVQDLHAENVALKRELCDLQEITARERAYDRQRIAKLESVDPQPLQKDRAEILHALLIANGGKMLAKDARKKMHLSPERFSNLLTVCDDFLEQKPYHLDRRQTVIILRGELVSSKY